MSTSFPVSLLPLANANPNPNPNAKPNLSANPNAKCNPDSNPERVVLFTVCVLALPYHFSSLCIHCLLPSISPSLPLLPPLSFVLLSLSLFPRSLSLFLFRSFLKFEIKCT